METGKIPEISVIIPAYNIEAYIERCVLSVVNGTYGQEKDDRLEILLVDDGSTDRTGALCDKLEKEYAVVRTIHQANGGLSAARNTGMDSASGKYILFLDGDDELEPETLKTLHETMEAENLDALFFGAIVIDNDSGNIRVECPYNRPTLTEEIMKGEHLFCEMVKSQKYIACVYLYMVRRELYEKWGMKFVPRLIHEDQPFTPQVLFAAERAAYRNHLFYRRYIREGSIMQSVSPVSETENYYRVVKELEQFAERTEMEEESRSCFYQHLTRYIKMVMVQYCHIPHPTKIQREYYKEMRRMGRRKEIAVSKRYPLRLAVIRMRKYPVWGWLVRKNPVLRWLVKKSGILKD